MAGRKRNSNVALEPLMRERDRLGEQLERLYGQAEALSNKIAGLDLAIALVQKGGGEQADDEAAEPKPASNVKVLLVDLARAAKAEGLNANIAVKMAAKHGIALKRGTAASNLSRLKTDGVLIHDGLRYKLPEFARPKSSGGFSSPPSSTVVTSISPGTTGTTAAVNPGFWVQTGAGARSKGS
jgi:hypothetical protein